ncbi:MAG: glutaredoxin family protein [Gammaproteobacteria bacterium]|jgi:hypothetical protein|nr:glutaredoxin family protein [Gammaproteobacteria bacterium]MBT5204345.1 glutaredoxin family protein [Gammaproteobacteria bacterium]MBT5603321.1 glutaredoxin family protein [Gammaproteobacteria bacterium]MBT6245480.1 glutaredoxin family protein [Gammaproteobacteria bacterium]
MKVNLYTTSGCHLCELALAQIQTLQLHFQISLTEVEIANSDDLIERYGVRIPVISTDQSTTELAWPFTLDQLRSFLLRPSV